MKTAPKLEGINPTNSILSVQWFQWNSLFLEVASKLWVVLETVFSLFPWLKSTHRHKVKRCLLLESTFASTKLIFILGMWCFKEISVIHYSTVQ